MTDCDHCTTHHHACDCREAEFGRLVAAFERYMAAVMCYHDNQWDLVNIRKYGEAKSCAERVLRDWRKAAK